MKFASKPNIQYLINWMKSHLAKKTDLDSYVEKKTGWDLSQNNLTDELVTKINNAGDSSFSGNYDDLTNKPDIAAQAVAAVNASTLATDVQTIKDDYVKASNVNGLITTAVANAGHVHFEHADSYDALPTTGDPTAIYYVPDPSATETSANKYLEYTWKDNRWEQTGGTNVDFDSFWKKADLEVLTNEELEQMITTE